MAHTGVWLIGARGNVATMATVGARAIARGLATTTGMVTARDPVASLEVPSVDELVFGGHEIRRGSLFEKAIDIAERNGVPKEATVEAVRSDLDAVDERIVTGTAANAPAFLAALHLAQQFAETRLPLLLVGETGTGKELLAHFIHRLSPRGGDLVDVNCGALPEDLADSLLFGHRKGAFTGAHTDRRGLLEEADGGTLFLDELGSMGSGTQRKLLRALETGEIRRVGGTKRGVNLRVVAAVQPGIAGQVREGSFRFDLMQRIAGAVIAVPALEERREDVVLIASHYARKLDKTLSEDARVTLRNREWPGNVRELRWTIERAAVLSPEDVITESILSEATTLGPQRIIRRSPKRGASDGRSRLRALCIEHEGDAEAIARALNVSRSTLYRRLSEFGLSLREYRTRPN